ncbi:hypothetical protein TNIN_354161 [Trichonephila inaurata madagascariensis]|uniref:TAZ-type domain-containing protein n=1 Tax=Trichonephila inaurata madagascariensis TaxID=2747483 RepID=A0A8X7C4I2_9ARAC|nr:hypothetical protein TNIN_354161 [Trichonephila inaurata madagascariensis]
MSLPTVKRKGSRLQFDVGKNLKVIFDLVNIEHASICEDLDCRSKACITTKAQIFHFRHCLGYQFCADCDQFFNVLVGHATSCEVERCPIFLCETMVELKRCMFPGAKKRIKEETNPAPSILHPAILKGYDGYPNLSEKLFRYIKRIRLSFKKAIPKPSKETLSSLDLDIQPNIPSTSKDVSHG